jgi:hypothetical protein
MNKLKYIHIALKIQASATLAIIRVYPLESNPVDFVLIPCCCY